MIRLLVFALLTTCPVAPALAAVACTSPTPDVVLPPQFSSLQVGRNAALLEDQTRQLGMESVLSPCHPWRASASQGIRPGISFSAWWARIRITNGGPHTRRIFLDTQDNLQDYVDIYVLSPQGKVLARWNTGDRRPFFQRPTVNNTVALPLTIASGATVDVYFRLDTYDGLHEVISPRIYTEDFYTEHIQRRYTINALYAGLALSLVVYNAFMYLSARVPMVGLYSLYSCTFLLWASTFYGLPFQYIWPGHPDFNNYWLALSACLAHYAGLYFFSRYIGKGAKGSQRAASRINTVLKLLLIVPTTFALIGQYLHTFVTLMPVNALMSMYIVSWAFIQWRRGNAMGRYVILAFTGLGIGVMLYFAKVLGFVDSNVITDNGIQIGSMLEILFVAFGVANQLNSIQAGRVAAEKQAYEAQRQLNIELDKLVRERTASLEQANAILHRLSTTDALTKMLNRRSFEQDLAGLLKSRQLHNEPFALCILDIDHFKWINDHLGHQTGDEVLKAVALTVRQMADARGAKAYRYGGEEFALVFPIGCDIESAYQTVDSIRLAISDLQIKHMGSEFGVVTASFGLIGYPAGSPVSDDTAEHPCVQADQLLYAAKREGRNQVASSTVSPPRPPPPQGSKGRPGVSEDKPPQSLPDHA